MTAASGTGSASGSVTICRYNTSLWTRGKVDEVAIYNGAALSPTRIAAHYTAMTTAPSSAKPWVYAFGLLKDLFRRRAA